MQQKNKFYRNILIFKVQKTALMKFILFSIFFVSSYFSCYAKPALRIKSGKWVGVLELTKNEKLYFEMQIENTKSNFKITVKNGDEIVPLNQPEIIGDSVHAKFSNFNTELVFKITSKNTIAGRWINHMKTNYEIPFSAQRSKEKAVFPVKSAGPTTTFEGRWKSLFKDMNGEEVAIGLFKQNGNKATGTFLTETGDYRFLSGNVDSNTLYLSGFDGSHAYLFIGTQDDQGKIKGLFLSGTHHRSVWTAERNETFQLSDADSITTFVGESKDDIILNFKNLDGSSFEFPNEQFKNKVVIIQIMGTWCANCMDETVYFKELYDKYNAKGLEIITVGYETGATFEECSKQLHAFQQRFNLKNTIVVGGNVRKNKVMDDFTFLSNFSSYPTSIFIDRKGNIARIHTGFSGPSTGKIYTDYKQETVRLIEDLIIQ